MMNVNAKPRRHHPQTGDTVRPLGDPLSVRGQLALLGWESVSAWAAAHGYERLMAAYCIRTWGNRVDRRPHGGIARALMADLRRTLVEGKRPEHMTSNLVG
jgi:hypothetical protein